MNTIQLSPATIVQILEQNPDIYAVVGDTEYTNSDAIAALATPKKELFTVGLQKDLLLVW